MHNCPVHPRHGGRAQPLRGPAVAHRLTLPLCLSNSNENQNRRHFVIAKLGLLGVGGAAEGGGKGKALPTGSESVPRSQRLREAERGGSPCGWGMSYPLRGSLYSGRRFANSLLALLAL